MHTNSSLIASEFHLSGTLKNKQANPAYEKHRRFFLDLVR